MNNYGEVIKNIRSGKGYSQKYVSEGICTQGNYSKFEIGENIDIKLTIFSEFINRLEISFEEFCYIKNDYQMPLREEIIQNFFNQTYNSVENLLKLEQSCNLYLSHSSTDKFIININIVVKGLIVFANSVEYDQAHKIIAPIWKELSLRNTLYLADIYLLNAILFIFPIETAMEIKKFAFRQIEKYRNYQNIERLKINFLINLSILNIKNGNYIDALNLIEDATVKCKKEQQFINLSICYIRKGICLNNLNLDGEYWINKGWGILDVLEQFDLKKILRNEIKHL